jgi:hypothetical protein
MANPFFENLSQKISYQEAVELVRSGINGRLIDFCNKNPDISYNSLKNALVEHKKNKSVTYPGIIKKALTALGHPCNLHKEFYYTIPPM